VEAKDFLTSLIHRRVDFRYSRRSLKFDLSTALFSSAAVDAGTVALLRALAGPIQESRPETILDVGCGTGTLGIALAAATGASLSATDRDALAVWFTRQNAELNGIAQIETKTALVVHSPFDKHQLKTPDLAVCNLPAKVGEPVLRNMITSLPQLVSPNGMVGVVIVRPLAQLLEDTLSQSGARVIGRHGTKGHLAVVYAPGDEGRDPVSHDTALDAAPDIVTLPLAYVRGSHTFEGPHGRYRLNAAHNLAEFDSLGHGTELAFRLFRRATPGGRILVWGTGQGHLAVGGIRSTHRAQVFIADRDVLAVVASAANLTESHKQVTVHPIVAPGLAVATDEIEGSVDWMIVRSQPEPGSLWTDEIVHAARKMLGHGGRLVIVSRSTSIARLLPALQASFSERDSVRHHGYRADLMIRKH
jgi:16S rRNA G1207 methylase RsmC